MYVKFNIVQQMQTALAFFTHSSKKLCLLCSQQQVKIKYTYEPCFISLTAEM